MIASRTRLAVAVALAAAAALAGVLLLARSAGGDDGRLAWNGTPALVQASAPTDRILYGRLRNDSLEDVDLRYQDVRVLDADGREVQSAVRFIAAFAHGLYPWSQRPDDVGDFERRRLGEIATLKPGQAAPITLSWRVPPGARQPVKVDFGTTELALPRGLKVLQGRN
jgi:hypothetical protein